MSEFSLRPNLISGPYPQTRERWPGAAERCLYAAQSRMRHAIDRARGSSAELLAAVRQHEARLRSASEAELRAAAGELRVRLRLNGLHRTLLPESLALIREVSTRVLEKRHFDVQVQGAYAMLNGDLIEMATGEGKTLTAALVSCTAAMAGIPVHVMTANDYLSERDRDILRPLYTWFGLSSAVVVDRSGEAERCSAYRADIVHATSQQFAFDYLRDRIKCGGATGRFQAQHLALSDVLWQRAQSLRMRGLCFAIVDEADSLLIDEAKTPLVISRTRGGEADSDYFTEILTFAQGLSAQEHFTVDARRKIVRLTEAGRRRIAAKSAASGRYWLRKERDAAVVLALRALHVLHINRDYLLRDGSVEIIDPMTGRPMPDRSWENGLHQFVEVKEGCVVTPPRDALAKITYQAFFKRYLRLTGMSGTLRESRRELVRVYGLRVRKIPRHKPSQLRLSATALHATVADKREAFLADIREQHGLGRPVLVGTASVEMSEQVSGWLSTAGLSHRVLNARQHRREAVIIAGAGRARSIVVATNMAGRGTDIPLAPGVAAMGGLHVINLSLNESARIDRQLYGRAGRQGDPGSACCILSLEDRELAGFYAPIFRKFATFGGLLRWLGGAMARLPQILAEREAYRQRLALIDVRKSRRHTLAFAGRAE